MYNELARRVWPIQKGENMLEEINNKIINEITELVNQTRTNLAHEINKSIICVYWKNYCFKWKWIQ